MVAEMERKFISECQRAGIEAVKARGIYGGVGRLKSVPDDEIRRRHPAGEGPTQISKALGIRRTSVYRAINEAQSDSGNDEGSLWIRTTTVPMEKRMPLIKSHSGSALR
jgi:DNA invertase Pin-like site-specific DNA recombinase